MKRLIYILLISLSINCSPVLQQPSVELPDAYMFGGALTCDSCPIDLRWWECFGDDNLNEIMDIALLNNRDLAATMANVEAARRYISVAKAEFLPSIYLTAEVEAYRINGVTTQEYTAAPTLEWELSLFGKLRNTRNSAMAEYLSKEWGYRAALLSLTTEVATTLFTLTQYQRSYDIAQRSYQLRRDATALVDSMHRYGMSNGIALEQARSLVYSAQSEMVKYQRAMEQTQLALNLLMGQASSPLVCNFTLSSSLPPSLPIGIPSDLLDRRPDVMEAYYNMCSEASKVGVARAERFPSITLTTDGGFISETLKDLSSAKPFGWSIIGELVQPIYNFGKLKRNEQMSYQEYLASMYSYEQATLSALRDVEKALVSISTYKDQLCSANSLVAANTKIAHTTSALYVRGMGNYLSVIDAERELYDSEIDFEEILMQQYINYVDLVKSLGGGFDTL